MKTILITGATDGLGLATAHALAETGHHLIVHGRDEKKLANMLNTIPNGVNITCLCADFGDLHQVNAMGKIIRQKFKKIDVLINNAGVLKVPDNSQDMIDLRFRVNTLAPYILYLNLVEPLTGGRVINLSSSAQSTIDMDAITGKKVYHDDMQAYSQSKLALTLWTFALANDSDRACDFMAVNPGSLLATKMVKEGFGIAGKDIASAVDLLSALSLSTQYNNVNGRYFDNDIGDFGQAHPDAYRAELQSDILATMDGVFRQL